MTTLVILIILSGLAAWFFRCITKASEDQLTMLEKIMVDQDYERALHNVEVVDNVPLWKHALYLATFFDPAPLYKDAL